MKKIAITALLCIAIAANSNMSRDVKKAIVVDSKKGLMWQDFEENNSTVLNQENALEYCKNSNFAGYNDWRLPSKDELLTIVDKNKKDTKINSSFKHSMPYAYWSSDSKLKYPDLSWRVNFNDGLAHWGAKRFDFFVRCVRNVNKSDIKMVKNK